MRVGLDLVREGEKTQEHSEESLCHKTREKHKSTGRSACATAVAFERSGPLWQTVGQ